jgi:hypothetical protein
MRRIFKEASSTIAWIGNASPLKSKYAFSLFRERASWEADSCSKALPRYFSEGVPPDERFGWVAVWEMMSDEWFQRS